ncbi:MAG: transcription antitermination factor NusB [Kiritimatiellales bacterium]|nr:transcription antitermination factor NusB [Kiritimatiellota bacterium]MBL7012631.1 transcription antitermination factor NusB [Kiritimatiellales bacterium]
MTGRRQAREWVVQFLFQTEFNPEELDQALEDFWNDEEKTPLDRDRNYVNEVIRGVIEQQMKIDRTIKRYTDNWDVDRLGVLDRIVLRVAVYEMLFRDDVPPVVSINEAIEIAKAYSGQKSARFVNGVLDRIQKELDRPARTPDTNG